MNSRIVYFVQRKSSDRSWSRSMTWKKRTHVRRARYIYPFDRYRTSLIDCYSSYQPPRSTRGNWS